MYLPISFWLHTNCAPSKKQSVKRTLVHTFPGRCVACSSCRPGMKRTNAWPDDWGSGSYKAMRPPQMARSKLTTTRTVRMVTRHGGKQRPLGMAISHGGMAISPGRMTPRATHPGRMTTRTTGTTGLGLAMKPKRNRMTSMMTGPTQKTSNSKTNGMKQTWQNNKQPRKQDTTMSCG